MNRNWMHKLKVNWTTILFLVAIIIFWEFVAIAHKRILEWLWFISGFIPPIPDWRFLSSPSEILISAPSEFFSGNLLTSFHQTLSHCLISFFIALCVGLLIAQTLTFSPWLRRGILPIIHGFSGIPPVTLLPLLLIAFGLDEKSVIALAAIGAIVSITLICFEAQSNIKMDFRLMLSNLGYSALGVWLWELSSLSENLRTAAREGLRWSLILCVVGEMHGSVAGGLGAYIDSGRLNQNYSAVYIGILACAMLAWLLKTGLNFGARYLHKGLKRFLLG
jgi:ABC-type nitrate/sulfonate/bicarbonate transport system permease component